MTENKTKAVSRRKFLKTGAVGATAAVAAVPYIANAETVLKVQAAWGGGIFLEFAQDYVDKVNAMSGGSLRAPNRRGESLSNHPPSPSRVLPV